MITGHAPQGKTLPRILVDLHEGGFAAYISASRAQTWKELFITHTISLEDLNQLVSSNLCQECHRLECLEHNTRIYYGFNTGTILPPLDPESESNTLGSSQRTLPTAPLVKNLSDPTPDSTQAALPHIHPNPPNCAVQTTLPHLCPDPPNHNAASSSPARCIWSANSCAYDTFFMIVFSMYRDAVDSWRQAFKTMGTWYEFLAGICEYLNMPANLANPQSFTECRDKLRNLLSDYDVDMFPPPGNHHTSINQVFDAFMKNSSYSVTLSLRFTSSAGCPVARNVLYLPNACSSGTWENAARRTDFLYTQLIQLFIDLQISAKIAV